MTKFETLAVFSSILLLLLANIANGAPEFTPQLSSACSATLSSIVMNLDPIGCGPTMSDTLTTSQDFTTCTSATSAGSSCFDFGDLNAVSQASKYYSPVYKIPAQSACSLCTPSQGMIASCVPLLGALTTSVYGHPIDYSTFGITNTTTIAATNLLIQQASVACSSLSELASVQIFEHQSTVLCDSSNTLGYTVDATSGNIENVVDMRSLTQCGQCAVVLCSPGQLCNGNGKAKMCPAGSYCPTPDYEVTCPSGYFCPKGSVEPQKCSAMAAGSCGKGALRQVVWIPLLIAFLIMGAIVVAFQYQQEIYEYINEQLTQKTNNGIKMRKVGTSAESKAEEASLSSVLAHTAPITITFKDVKLVSGKNTRISNVSGVIRPGKFTAILGGSGAGKTSLMNVILGREAATSGDIVYSSPAYKDNKANIPSRILDRVVAFVPQNDVYLREMTVFELVLHSALSRLPSSLTRAEILARVEGVLTQLELQPIRDVMVGGAMGGNDASSLSPGDRKLVNIALELVSGPNILFLDEPTTGIDASSALNVARIVSNLAHTGLTCVAVIHQPRAEIFSLIDEMIILIRGGKIAYQGPAACVLDYFKTHGCTPSSRNLNKTDYLIDITSIFPKVASECGSVVNTASIDSVELGTTEGKGSHMVTWADLWAKTGQEFLESTSHYKQNPAVHHHTQHDANHPVDLTSPDFEPPHSLKAAPIDVPRPGFSRQLALCFYRGVLQHFKNNVMLTDMLIALVGGIILGIVTVGGPLFVNAIPNAYTGSCPPGAEIKCNQWLRFEVGPATFLVTMILGAITIPLAIRTFGREKEVFAREATIGVNKAAYFLGKMLSDLPFICLNVFIFLAPLVCIAQWRAPVDKFYAVLLCCAICEASMGYFLCFVFADPDSATLTGVILAVLLNLFSGFVPTIGEGPIGLIMYTHWSARGITAAELYYGQGLDTWDEFNTVVGDEWKDPDLSMDCVYMIVIAVILQTLGFALMLYGNRRVTTFK